MSFDGTIPTVSPANTASAFARIPLPHPASIAQPTGKTLVNFDTIYHAERGTPDALAHAVLGRGSASGRHRRLRWVFGDGETLTTETAGAAYPNREVVHRYQRAGTFRHQVEVAWTARWALDGGPFKDVPGSVTTNGQKTALRVVEATPSLSGG